MTRAKLIQLIHVGKSQLHFDNYTYRAFLHDLTGKSSCAEMTMQELELVLFRMRQRGFAVYHSQNSAKTANQKADKSTITPRIRLLWQTMHKAGVLRSGSDASLERWAMRVVNDEARKKGSKIMKMHLTALNNAEATLVFERLKQWARRYQIT